MVNGLIFKTKNRVIIDIQNKKIENELQTEELI